MDLRDELREGLRENDKLFLYYEAVFNELNKQKSSLKDLKKYVPANVSGIGLSTRTSESAIIPGNHIVNTLEYYLFPDVPKDEISSNLNNNIILYDSKLIAKLSYLERYVDIHKGLFGFLGIGEIIDTQIKRTGKELSFVQDVQPQINSFKINNEDKCKYFLLIKNNDLIINESRPFHLIHKKDDSNGLNTKVINYV